MSVQPRTPTSARRALGPLSTPPAYSPPPASPGSPAGAYAGLASYPFPNTTGRSIGYTSAASGSGSISMSQRPSHAQAASPSTPEYGAHRSRTTVLKLREPARSPSPSLAAEAKHRAQLQAYDRTSKGRPSRDGSRDRSKSDKDSGKRHRGISGRLYALGRRLSSITEDGGESGAGMSGARRLSVGLVVAARAASGSFPKRKRRFFSCLSIAFTIYFILHFFVFRSFSRPETTSDPHGAPKRSDSSPRFKHLSSAAAARAMKTGRPALPAHVKRAGDHAVVDGMLHVNPNSTVHPIYQLIRDGRAEWDAKVARQSKTLKDAVAEYRRRHHRAPPVGFDKWWAYVQANQVQLPDEYDQIARDVYPFFALAPRELENRLYDVTLKPDSYTIRIKHGSIRTSTSQDVDIVGADMRLEGQLELLKPIARYLPDLQATYSVHDSAELLMSYEHRLDLMENVAEDEWLDERQVDFSVRGFLSACPPSTRTKLANPPPRPHKSFVSSARTQTDLCTHPELFALHGTTAHKNPHVFPLTPLFMLSKTSLHAEILGVPTEQWMGPDDLPIIPWAEKEDERLLWRGSNTGTHYTEDHDWSNSHRVRLVRDLNAQWGSADVLPAPKAMGGKSVGMTTKELGKADLNKWAGDISFAGEPIQCEEGDGTCSALRDKFRFLPERMTFEDALRYKYVIDVDGNAWSARFNRLLTSGSLIFKSTIMPEWWTDRIAPWVHYVPVQLNYSDVYDALTFFRGDSVTGKGGEAQLAQNIADAGREWAKTHWRKEDMTAYAFRLYLEWARVTSPSRGKMDFVYEPEMEVAKE